MFRFLATQRSFAYLPIQRTHRKDCFAYLPIIGTPLSWQEMLALGRMTLAKPRQRSSFVFPVEHGRNSNSLLVYLQSFYLKLI